MDNFIVTFVLGENVQEVKRFTSPGLAQQFIKHNKQSSQFVRGKLQLRTEKGFKHKKII